MAEYDEALLASDIEDGLREIGSFDITCPEADVDRVRSIGRRVGRELGWKIQTVRSAVAVNGMVRVVIVVKESNPLHAQLIRIREEKAMRRAMERTADD
ncbi:MULTISPECIES: hypothetical protein [unclassified Gordonia (in: high G+C Gram-positive bacteria)]|uniref:hypothetical protein n=1 Tax=unclassified Gordonia (in: high G+C Gram-positive bacteria) TaxID=2657482 RepID=UPI001F0D8484|nr:hypothetical protein [Gordonia sp. ABSL49_1]MCH5643965.1 hypothetical protein [Gordonia sp. ABSL49_1]